MKGWRTVVFNGAVAAIPLTDWVLSNGQIIGPFLQANAPLVMAGVAFVNLLLRKVTSTPLGVKG